MPAPLQWSLLKPSMRKFDGETGFRHSTIRGQTLNFKSIYDLSMIGCFMASFIFRR